MKCTCGLERSEGSALCRMFQDGSGGFRVEIYGSNDRILAQSRSELSVKEALDFVVRAVDCTLMGTHFHWEIESADTNVPQKLQLFTLKRGRK